MEKALEKMSEEELFGFFLPKESARDLMREYDSAYNVLRNASEKQLGKIDGLGATRVNRLLALKELMHRMDEGRAQQRKVIHGPADACAYFDFLRTHQQEEVWVLTLDSKSHVLRGRCIVKGTVRSALVTPREVFHVAVLDMAASVIVAHNHPSGDPEPSRDDMVTTRRMVEAGKVLDINCFDHVIIGDTSQSLREQYPNLWEE